MVNLASCYLCGSPERIKRKGVVRDKPELDIFECKSCGLVYLSSHDHIGNIFYSESGMHSGNADVDSWLVEGRADDLRRAAMLENRVSGKTVLDFGAGAGGFVEQIRKNTKKICVIEPDQSVKKRYKLLDIHQMSGLDELNEEDEFEFITAFHVIEHLVNPVETLEKLRRHLKKGVGRLCIEVPNSNDALLTIFDSEAFSKFTYWSPHLFLYNEHTIRKLAKKAGFSVQYVKHIQRYPLSNHLYWMARGKPGGHKVWNFLASEQLESSYEAVLASVGATDTIIAELFWE